MNLDKLKEILKNNNKRPLDIDTLFNEAKTDFNEIETYKLCEANFNEYDLEKADFSNANLVGASFIRANLTRANFSGANLTGTNLMGANLWEANFIGAIYSVTNLLKAYWDIREKHLILELMAHDAESCGIEAIDKWATNKGKCPFKNSERDYYFLEDKHLWLTAKPEDKIPKLRGHKLLEALAKACKIKL